MKKIVFFLMLALLSSCDIKVGVATNEIINSSDTIGQPRLKYYSVLDGTKLGGTIQVGDTVSLIRKDNKLFATREKVLGCRKALVLDIHR